TALAVAAATGTVGGTTTLTATLTSGGNGVPNEVVTFSINGDSEGTATTNGSGGATLSVVSLVGFNPGTYPGYVTARFAGDGNYAPSAATTALVVVPPPPALTSPSNGATVVGTSVTVSGTGFPGATVTLFDAGLNVGTAFVDTAGNFSGALTLGYGGHS